MQTQPDWNLYATFLAVFEGGSLSAAARALNSAQPTVRRQVAELEAALGSILFIRSKAGLVPTDAAMRAYPLAQAMAAHAEALSRAASGDEDAGGTVRITCSEVVSVEVLPPILARLAEEHSGLEFEISPTDRPEDLLQRDADIAIRMFRPRQSNLIARRACTIEVGLFASEAYLARHPAPQTFEELLSDHRVIGDDHASGFFEALARQGATLTRRDVAWRIDSGLGKIGAIRAGFGIGPCQAPLAASTVPPLRRVLPHLGSSMETWVAMHEDLKTVRRVRLVFDALCSGLAAYVRQ